MTNTIILKTYPIIEFQLRDSGFELIDEQTASNSGFYHYNDLQSTVVNNAWFPILAKWLRVFTWLFNGVPFFPDAESYKKSSLMLHFKQSKLGIWLTDASMADNAKKVKALLDENSKLNSILN